jgi:predicted transcriptional regulator
MPMDESAKDRNDEHLDWAQLARLTTDIVVAYAANNATTLADLTEVIGMVGDRLKALGHEPAEMAPNKPEPAVSVRRSVSPEQITCLVCGKSQKILKRHLMVAHDLTPAAYRELFDLKPDYPMIAPSYAEQRSELAKRIGLGRKQPPPPQRRRRKAAAESAPPQ